MNDDPCGAFKSCVWRVSKALGITPGSLCVAVNDYGDPCGKRTVQVTGAPPELPLCREHFKGMIDYWSDFYGPEDIAEMSAAKTVRLRYRIKVREDKNAWEGNVYFAARDDTVKIGYSTQPERRRKAIESNGGPIDEFLVIPGTKDDEADYHLQFDEYRIKGEWFHLSEEICDEMRALAAAEYDSSVA